MDMKEWFNYGVPAAFLFLIAAGVVAVIRWVKPWVEKVFTSHLLLIETLQKQAIRQSRSLDQLTEVSRSIHQEQMLTTELEQKCVESTREMAVESKKQTIELEKQTRAMHEQAKAMQEQASSLSDHRARLEHVIREIKPKPA